VSEAAAGGEVVIRVNLLEPKAELTLVHPWRGYAHLYVKQGTHTVFCYLQLWQNQTPRSWFTVKKSKTVVWYKEN
jgi:hypothetical protein